MRGASSLEGFHAHQKRWLGFAGEHALEAGLALVAEGTMRWNRKLNAEGDNSENATLLFANGLLQEIKETHQRLTGSECYQNYQLVEPLPRYPPIGHIAELSGGSS